MKKVFLIFAALLLTININSFAAFTESKIAQKESYGAFKSADMRAAAESFVNMSRKDYEQLTGKRLSLAERLALKCNRNG